MSLNFRDENLSPNAVQFYGRQTPIRTLETSNSGNKSLINFGLSYTTQANRVVPTRESESFTLYNTLHKVITQ